MAPLLSLAIYLAAVAPPAPPPTTTTRGFAWPSASTIGEAKVTEAAPAAPKNVLLFKAIFLSLIVLS